MRRAAAGACVTARLPLCALSSFSHTLSLFALGSAHPCSPRGEKPHVSARCSDLRASSHCRSAEDDGDVGGSDSGGLFCAYFRFQKLERCPVCFLFLSLQPPISVRFAMTETSNIMTAPGIRSPFSRQLVARIVHRLTPRTILIVIALCLSYKVLPRLQWLWRSLRSRAFLRLLAPRPDAL